MTPALLAFAAGFLLGSIPFAWLLVRLRSREDLDRVGSGNIGALNALKATRSAWTGAAVVLLDGLKGAAAVWLAVQVGIAGAEPFVLQAAAAVGVVAGHNYNPWLTWARRRLSGGKGFSAAAGALLVFLPWLVVVWLGAGVVAWGALRLARGIVDEAPASAVATLAIIPGAALLYDGRAALAAACLALVIAPRLVAEVLALLFVKDA